MYAKELVEPETEWEYAIFDTESNRFVTSVWSMGMINKIWRMWEMNHGAIFMNRFEIRPRSYNDSVIKPDNAILVVARETNIIVCYYHDVSKGYAKSFDPTEYKFISWSPPSGLDVTDVYDRNPFVKWDRTGTEIKLD